MTSNSQPRTPATILEGDRGSFVITEEMLWRSRADHLHHFELMVLNEARKRGLVVVAEYDRRSMLYRISWFPEEDDRGDEERQSGPGAGLRGEVEGG